MSSHQFVHAHLPVVELLHGEELPQLARVQAPGLEEVAGARVPDGRLEDSRLNANRKVRVWVPEVTHQAACRAPLHVLTARRQFRKN